MATKNDFMKDKLIEIAQNSRRWLRRSVRRLCPKLTGRKTIEDMVMTPIPPNDASRGELQDCCYRLRDIAEEWLEGK